MFCLRMIDRCLLFLLLRRSCVGTGSVLDLCLGRLWYELSAGILRLRHWLLLVISVCGRINICFHFIAEALLITLTDEYFFK